MELRLIKFQVRLTDLDFSPNWETTCHAFTILVVAFTLQFAFLFPFLLFSRKYSTWFLYINKQNVYINTIHSLTSHDGTSHHMKGIVPCLCHSATCKTLGKFSHCWQCSITCLICPRKNFRALNFELFFEESMPSDDLHQFLIDSNSIS